MARTHKKIGLVALNVVNNKLNISFPKHFTEKECTDFKTIYKSEIREFTDRLIFKGKKSVNKVQTVEEKELSVKQNIDELNRENVDLLDYCEQLKKNNIETVAKCEADKKALHEKIESNLNEFIELDTKIVNCESDKKALLESFETLEKSNKKLQIDKAAIEVTVKLFEDKIKKLQKTVELQTQQFESQEKEVEELKSENTELHIALKKALNVKTNQEKGK